ncbi:PorP/SprF family type IX secretion system membrane protein [Cecembia rubra]|uniref:Type IX secretion system PorP/SprF family membrane protein n=1 Tax=Cecembia rubra TaxID=1485585 RepID=A0A2P8DX13_9BACT|nr:type IX secretion system membrane protein PorP/SprF [Cecembia rubra]PSL01760.1 type IX secretion system PorP/SprF family membrane protein [Cecembia rubra]
MRKLLAVIFISLLIKSGYGQDIQFSQFYASPLFLNPAFAGSAEVSRFGINFRNQWPGLDQTFIAYSAYFDHFVNNKNSGIGLIINGSYQTLNNLANNEVGLAYSYRLKIGNGSFLHMGAQGSYATRSAAFDEVVLSAQLDIDRGVVLPGSVNGFPEDRTRTFLDVHSGLLFYNDKVWFGVSGHHLTQPNISYIEGDFDPLEIRVSMHGGVKFDLPRGVINDFLNNTRQERTLAFAFNYKRQGLFDQLDLGAELFFDPVILGVWYRGLPTRIGLPNNEALIVMLGFLFENGVQVGYSYDFTLSALGWRNSGGAHEVSVRYDFIQQLWGPRNRKGLPSFKF